MSSTISPDMEELKHRLAEGGHTLVVAKGDDVRCYDRRGVADLYHLLRDDPGFLDGAVVADKVVGRAAAALMILGGVSRIHTRVISSFALSLFAASGVSVEYDVETHHIINRSGDGWCPLELRCKDCVTPQECYERISEFMEEMNNKIK